MLLSQIFLTDLSMKFENIDYTQRRVTSAGGAGPLQLTYKEKY